MLHTEPSFAVYADEDPDGLVDNNIKKGDLLKGKLGNDEFSFPLSIEEKEDEQIEPVAINGGQNFDVDEENRKRMVDEDPSNPVFLKNYAHHLQSIGDLNGAEEYYFRATMADPKDGEVMMQYGKLVWALHRDQDRALGYLESAVRAAPEDTNVLAAYASFMWDIDEDVESAEEANPLVEETSTGLGVDVSGLSSDELEEYYKRTVDEKCSDPFLLRNYARFLQQTKGDVEGAEEYYLRAVRADPEDGELVSEYAQLVWEVRHDQDLAAGYFKQAVEAAPMDSNVLAAYAKFLWEAEEEDDE